MADGRLKCAGGDIWNRRRNFFGAGLHSHMMCVDRHGIIPTDALPRAGIVMATDASKLRIE